MFHEDPFGPPPAIPAHAPTPALCEEQPWRLLDVLAGGVLAVIGFFVVLAISIAVIVTGGYARTDPGVALLLTLTTLGLEVWLGLIVLGLARLRRLPLAALGLLRAPVRWSYVPLALFGAYGCVLAYAGAVALAERVTGFDLSSIREGNQIPDDLPRTAVIWITLGLAVVVAAPLSEELFFRGLVFRGIAGRFGTVPGLVISGIAFSLVHFNVSVVVPFTLIGMVFAGVYRASGSLWTTIAAHAIFNGVSFMATVYGVGS